MTPEEKFDNKIWEILQKIKEEVIFNNTQEIKWKEGKYDPENEEPYSFEKGEKAVLEKLEDLSAIKMSGCIGVLKHLPEPKLTDPNFDYAEYCRLLNNGGISSRYLYLKVLQPKFDEICKKFKKLNEEQIERVSENFKEIKSSYWIRKEEDGKYLYKNRPVIIKNQKANYFIIFDVVYHLAETGGNLKYKDIIECCKKRNLSKTTRKKIQKALTGESADFFKHVKEIDRIVSGGICLFEASPDGNFLTFNNKKN